MMRQLILELARPAPPTFAAFVAGRNAEAVQGLQALALGCPAERYVYLWGVAGSGRTHLLRAVAEAMSGAGRACAYVECDAATTDMPLADDTACLLVDDVERLPAQGQVALFNAYNALREREGALVATGDVPAVQLPLRPDVITRLGWGLVYQLHPLTDEEKAKAMADHAARRGYSLGPDVCGYLMRHAARDLGSLLAAVDALDRYSLESKRPVTLALARALLHERKP
jgi:DnaA-homolog protein